MFTAMAREAMRHPDPLADLRRPPAQTPQGPSYFVGLDLGQAQDYTALSVVQRTEYTKPDDPTRTLRRYAVRYLERWKLGTTYTDIVSDLARLSAQVPLPGSTLVVDATGCGRPVVEMIRNARLPLKIVPITIHGGHAVRPQPGGGRSVPKKDLVAIMQTLLQTGRFQIVPTLREAGILGDELRSFKVKVTLPTGNEIFEAWRERDHDDIVLSVALACWFGERGQRQLNIW
jgi:hypothetical protein